MELGEQLVDIIFTFLADFFGTLFSFLENLFSGLRNSD